MAARCDSSFIYEHEEAIQMSQCSVSNATHSSVTARLLSSSSRFLTDIEPIFVEEQLINSTKSMRE